jgi:CBS domain-containing protein
LLTIRKVICDREPFSVSHTVTAMDAAEFMSSRNISAVCVLDDEGKLCGVFSERDMLRRVVVKGLDATKTAMREVMSVPRAVISCDETPHQALERMERAGVRHLPVVDGEKWIGMLSMRDLMRVELSEQGDEIKLLHEYISH